MGANISRSLGATPLPIIDTIGGKQGSLLVPVLEAVDAQRHSAHFAGHLRARVARGVHSGAPHRHPLRQGLGVVLDTALLEESPVADFHGGR